MAADYLGQALTPAQIEVRDYFQAVGLREDIFFYVCLEPGEAFVIDNLTVLHSCTEFGDHDEPDQRWHLLRLWLKNPDACPVAAGVRRWDGGSGIAPNVNPSTTYLH